MYNRRVHAILDTEVVRVQVFYLASGVECSIEVVDFDDLEEDEKAAIIQGRKEEENGETVDFEDYLRERGIKV